MQRSVIKLLRSVHSRRQVAATSRGDRSLGVYRSGDQLQIASYVLERFYENLCLCNRILSLQQVTQILSDLIFCNMLQRQRFSQKFPSTHEAICRCVVSFRHVVATCCPVCTDLYKHNLQVYNSHCFRV